jgi:preprotein translocase subunit SecE
MGRLLKKKDKSKKKKQVENTVKKFEEPGKTSGNQSGTESGSAGVMGSIAQKVSPQKKNVPVAKTSTGKQRFGFIEKSIQFLREVKIELKKVTWPSRKQTIGSTVVVIVLVMIISFFLGAVDIGLSSLVKVVLQ